VSLPWSVIAIYCPYRYLSLAIAVFSICRVFYGPWFLHKLFLILYEMSATVYVRCVCQYDVQPWRCTVCPSVSQLCLAVIDCAVHRTEEERDRFAASCCGFRARLVANMMLAFISPILLGVFAFFLLLVFTGVSFGHFMCCLQHNFSLARFFLSRTLTVQQSDPRYAERR
jgi:hypothetical protein